MRRVVALMTIATGLVALTLCSAVGCSKGQNGGAAVVPAKGTGKSKIPSAEEKAARQEAARAKGITPDADQGPAKTLTATPDQKKGR